jgi:uridylate kinase
VRASAAVEAVLAEKAVLMTEALADVVLATTIATAYADNIRQQTTINIEARGKVVVGGGNDRGVVMAVLTTVTTAVAAATQQRRRQPKRWWRRQRQWR